MAKVWHYRDKSGNDVIKEWATQNDKRQIIKLQAKIDLLIQYGSELPPQLLADTGQPHIKKIKIHGNPQLRPLLCRITDDTAEGEFVLLVGAKEVGWNYDPPDALATAAARRQEVLKDESRKTEHVRLIDKTAK